MSFLLPIPGFIAGAIFRRHNHMRNYRACKKGAVAGIITLAAVLAILGLLIVATVI